MRTARACPVGRLRRAGFTLIELLAVILILGLVASLVGPPLGLRSGRALDEATDRLSAACEFARQRAVMTGRTHRLALELDWNLYRYRVEWIPPVEYQAPVETAEDLGASRHVDLSPPSPEESGDFVPVPGGPGRDARLGEGVYVLAVETDAGPVDDGWVTLEFGADGTADAAEIWLGEEDGRPRRVLQVLPLADAVRVRDAEA